MRRESRQRSRKSSDLARAWRGPGARFGPWPANPALLAGMAVLAGAVVIGALLVSRSSSGSSKPSTTEAAPTTTLPTTAPSKAVPIASGPSAPVFTRIPTADPVVFLTIDDGLIRDPAVVEFLKKHRVPVTLFPVVSAAREGEAYFEELQAIGATIQDHTVNHKAVNTLTPFGQHAEICKAADEFMLRFGQRPWLFRPPEGKYNDATRGEARACGMRAIVLWNGATNDGRLDLQHSGRLQPGDIILMHFRTDLLQNLRVVLRAAKAAGLEPGRLEEYLPPPDPTGS
jgi:peptidoglycan/xylan/chitin deacetylase (PgdA/CDA1 family)